jgi:uncharacterized DUF497 family protein
MIGFEWDPEKAASNLEKHRIDFDDAAEALHNGVALTQRSPPGTEIRFNTICRFNGRLIFVVWTPRAGAIRLISARSASKDEKAQFRQAIDQ